MSSDEPAKSPVLVDMEANKPFAMLGAHSLDHLISQVRRQCDLSDEELVEDAYPCTDLQEALMASTVKQPGSHVDKYVYRISPNVDLCRFKAAFEATIAACTSLRTRIIVFEGSAIQVVTKEKPSWGWNHCPDLAASLQAAWELEMMTYGSRLCRYTIAKGPDNHDYFVWVMHRTICDEWTVRLNLETLRRFYQSDDCVPVLHSHARFVRYTRELDSANAAEYWTTQLKHAQRCAFPLPKAGGGSVQQLHEPRAHTRKEIAFRDPDSSAITGENLLRAAWAIVLARYIDGNDVCFGTTVSGRQAPIDGLDRITGLVAAIVPVRARLEDDSTVQDFLRQIQKQMAEMAPYEQYGLQRIAKLSPDAEEACNFSSLLIVHPAHETKMLVEAGTDVLLEPIADEQIWEGHHHQLDNSHSDYALTLQLQIHDQNLEFHASYDPGVLVEAQITALSHHFGHVVQQLLSPRETTRLRDVSLAGPWDLQQATAWNGERTTEVVDDCVHRMIAKQAQQTPNAPAICAWDGDLTYSELDAAADRLAHRLAREGVRAGAIVHVCFEKSVWFFVSILAINKAGAAWVPLDPSHPVQRLREIVHQMEAKLALTSASNAEICIGLGLTVIEVTAALDRAMADDETTATALDRTTLDDGTKFTSQLPLECQATGQDAAYVLFTSGSTGTPKGLVIEHRSLCTSMVAIGARLGLTASVRMLQFGSYVFDGCIGETFAALLAGGCVCVPSDEVRWNGFAGFIRDTRVNSAFLTPSFVRTIKPAEVPSLSLLVVGGESSSQDILDVWLGNVRLFNGWGPAEIIVFGTLHEWKSASESPSTVGKPVAGSCWIVDPDHERLAPIGCIGEILMQQMWASILKIPAETIGREDNFLQIGGDSISMIHLVSLARRQHGIALTVASIFEDARLSRVAAIASSAGVAPPPSPPPPPLSLLPEGRADELLDQAWRQCGLPDIQAIEDAYPCTPLQEGLMALAIRWPGSYMVRWVYQLSPHVDSARFKDAWERTVALCADLRTRIILADGCSLQVVVKDDVAWEAWGPPADGQVDSAVEEARKIEMVPGSRLWRYALTQGADGQSYFTLVAHHAVYDGWSIGLILQRLLCFYKDAAATALEPYSRFIQYLGGLDREATARYWTAQLREAKQAAFPPRKPGAPSNTTATADPVTRTLTKPIAFSQPASSSSVTRATILRAAWAIVLARYCDTPDVCFGVSVSGRHAPLQGLESMSGPLVATVPVRVRLDAEQTVADFLRDMQTHASGMTPHEQFGLQNISKVSEDARAACDFTSILVVHPAVILDGIRAADSIMVPAATTGAVAAYQYFGYPLVIQVLLHEKNVEFSATYDPAVLADVQVTALSHHFDRVVQQLLSPSPGETLLRDVSLAGPWDLQQAVSWNGQGPEIIDDSNSQRCVGLGLKVVEVTPTLDKTLTSGKAEAVSQLSPICEVTPQDAAQVATAKRVGLTRDARMLQFSSYAFDAFIFEALYSLMSGACLCVPSDTARLTNLEEFINTMGITWVDLTPTFARILDSNKVPNVQVLVIGGEAAGQDILRKWAGKTRLINVWGPAETCVLSTCHEYQSIYESPLTVETKWSRYFKTGDLGFYNPDGTIEFVGRKDTQVKIHGQRVELGEVEYNIQTILEGIKQVVVDVFQTEVGSNLIAYLCFSQETRLTGKDDREAVTDDTAADDINDLFLPLVGDVQKQVWGLVKELKMKLPGYMVPTTFVPCRYMPYTVSTKLDRGKLRQKTAALSQDDIARYSLVDSGSEKQAPETAMETKMQQLWASVLMVPAETIGRDDNFLQLGGNSISAIRLVLLARGHGITLTVPSVFENAQLWRLAAAAEQSSVL
ncbi:hypothetical protein DL771_002488 [Monosporascus sp. 5C6A]|nr:hypothetical protein DL771_002488 [Monosporascus sp. 5C6A]